MKGELEKIQDEFIDLVSKEKGWSLKDFYATDGKELNDLLSLTVDGIFSADL